jgi:hypothetical protein
MRQTIFREDKKESVYIFPNIGNAINKETEK